jgi:hypothetical protein
LVRETRSGSLYIGTGDQVREFIDRYSITGQGVYRLVPSGDQVREYAFWCWRPGKRVSTVCMYMLETRHRLKTRKKGRVKVERGHVVISAHVGWGWATLLQCLTCGEMRVFVPLPAGRSVQLQGGFQQFSAPVYIGVQAGFCGLGTVRGVGWGLLV